MGIELQKETIQEEMLFEGRKLEGEKIIINPKKKLKGFTIGHKVESKTRFINSIECEQAKIMICDTPGFEDSRGVEIDIANGIGITSALQGCRSVRPLLLINYHELKADRCKPLRETLRLVTRMMQNIEEHQTKINVVLTHVEENTNPKQIMSTLVDLLDAQEVKNIP